MPLLHVVAIANGTTIDCKPRLTYKDVGTWREQERKP